MTKKPGLLNIGVLFGGRSGEHDVSLASSATVMTHLDRTKYKVFALGIRRDGGFATERESRDMLVKPLDWVTPAKGVISNKKSGNLLEIHAVTETAGKEESFHMDVFFPVLHGPFGEDGTLQGLLEMTGSPYVGCGTATSACGMDKELTKRLLRESGLPVIPYRIVHKSEWESSRRRTTDLVVSDVGAPCFVKPCRMGSSVGITRVNELSKIEHAIDEALQHDYKALVEKALDAREFECSVMGNRIISVSQPGEILPSREFYDYSAKYLDGDASKLLIPAPVSEELSGKLRHLAKKAFLSLGGEGFGRVDFLQNRSDESIYINEINTIPGFTEISMFPKLWVHEGKSISEVLEHLVDLALERHKWKTELKNMR